MFKTYSVIRHKYYTVHPYIPGINIPIIYCDLYCDYCVYLYFVTTTVPVTGTSRPSSGVDRGRQRQGSHLAQGSNDRGLDERWGPETI